MPELERVGRLPVFIDEEQWSRAFDAAKQEIEVLVALGEAPQVTVSVAHRMATRIATAALRAAAQDDEGDVGDLPGVSVQQIATYTFSVATYEIGDGGVEPDEYFSG